MKKFYFLFIIFIFIFFTCTVNENTGLITITNLTQSDFSSVRVGQTTLSAYLARGVKVDYWYFIPLSGKLDGVGVSDVLLYNDGTTTETRNETKLNFKLNYEYKIEIIERDGSNWFYLHRGVKANGDYDDSDMYHDPTD